MNKREFTESIIKEANLDMAVNHAMKSWWFTSTDDHYRLTYRGYKTLKLITPFFKFNLKHPMTLQLYSILGKLNCAYFIYASGAKQEVHIFSTKIATVIQLYGSIDRYIATL